MISQILPGGVIAIEARSDRVDAGLFAEEEEMVGAASDQRRREFTTARACAREALTKMGLSPVPIISGPDGEPCWPPGVIGSITHCRGYRACVIARRRDYVALGIDAEPDEPLPSHLLLDVTRSEERVPLQILSCNLPGINWDRLLFSAKESVYKAWFPLTSRPLWFDDAVVSIDPPSRTFLARLCLNTNRSDHTPKEFTGRWLVRDGLILTAIVESEG